MMDAEAERTITEGSRALELFTDRVDACRRFCSYLNDDPPPSSVLVFHGDGGNGKSLLLNHLRTRLSKRIEQDNWNYLKSLDGEECTAQVADADIESIPVGRLDFAEARFHNGFEALLKLRRDLSGRGLRFPLFDFAVVTYLHKSKQLTDEYLRGLFPSDEVEFIVELASLVKEEIPGVRFAVAFTALLDRRFGNWFRLHRQQRNLEDAHVEAIDRMDHETELIQELPNLFAHDLNAALGDPGAPTRIALFFDTHEAFWGSERKLEGDLYFERDEWLRRLVRAIDRTIGIVIVVAGHDVPKWIAAPRWEMSDLEPHHISELTNADALTYLERAGVADTNLRERLCEDARVGSDQIHPFLLGLGADLVLAAAEKGVALTQADLELSSHTGDRHQLLINRLLRYVETEMRDAVAAVSTCRSFDQTIYRFLGQELHFLTSRASFAVLTGFSFVHRTEVDGADRYRVHELLRRLPLELTREQVRREANAALERHYRERAEFGDDFALAEAIYHANQLDWQRGVAEWVGRFEEALSQSRFDRCRALLSIRNDLRIDAPQWLGIVSRTEADYFQTLSRHQEAHAEYVEAIAALDKALVHAPDNPEIHNDRGITLHRLGNLEGKLSQSSEAEITYLASIAAYDHALVISSGHPAAQNNRILALQALGNLQARLSRSGEAEANFREAISAFDQIIVHTPNNPGIHSNRGIALHRLSDLQAMYGRTGEAGTSYREAIAAHKQALDLAPDNPVVHSNLGMALHSLGNLQAMLSPNGEAEDSYEGAVAAFDQALILGPDNPDIHDNRGLALRALGDLQTLMYLQVLSVLQAMGNWQVIPNRASEAEVSYEKAMAASDQALVIAPNNPEYHSNRGITLQRLGDLHARLNEAGGAEVSYLKAISAFDQALERAPNDPRLHCNRGSALLALGEQQAKLRRVDDADTSFQAAIVAYDQSLERAFDDIPSLKGRALANEYLCRLRLEVLGERGREAANYSLRAALTDIMHVLRLVPHDPATQVVRQRILAMLKELEGDNS